NVGAYHAGSNPNIDEAIQKHEAIETFLRQETDEKSALEDTLAGLARISGHPIPEEEIA
ncbi:MAG: flagellum-specific ATP synthase FliI, partial [Spirochaetaceae bacterium]|nr:flagellum-specific ATP synthase FliI [Spirochaetaceae bacterium]